ncbi:hypothetical protein J6590_075214 [Homalodisca vitripennis]|nr:hypothetical protein J6590_075214 [Homalodisca vitripennis]
MRIITVFCVFLICYRADGVDILVAYDDGVEYFNSSEHSFRSLVLPSAPVSAVDYHYQRKEAFAAWDNRIYRFSFDVFISSIIVKRNPSCSVSGTRKRHRGVRWLWHNQCVSFGQNIVHKFCGFEAYTVSFTIPHVEYPIQIKYPRFPLFNNDSSRSFSPTSVANISLCWSFAVDWVHDHVFWPDCGIDAAIMMSDLDGGNITVIVPLSQNRPIWIPDIAIDPYRGLLFWISDGSVLSCGLDGREITTVAKLAFTEAVNLVLDMVAKRIYLLSRNKSFNGIYYLEYHSSEPLLIHDEVDGKIWSFSVYKSQLYLCYDSSNGTYLTTRSVADHASSKQQLTNLSKTVWHMKVIDPELQTPPEIDQCTSKGCSHHCVVQESLALCRCPRNFHLGRDQMICETMNVKFSTTSPSLNAVSGPYTVTYLTARTWSLARLKKSKRIIQAKNDTFLSVLEGIACVVFILLAAGILMCLCDKVWSNVHPTVVRVTSPSNSFKRRIYKGSDLSENLI